MNNGIYCSIDEYNSRNALEEDYDSIYNILLPLVVQKDESIDIENSEKRKLRNNIKFYAKKYCCIVIEKDKEILAVSLSKGNFWVHLGVKSSNIKVLSLLLYTVLYKCMNINKPIEFTKINNTILKGMSRLNISVDSNTNLVTINSIKEKVKLLFQSFKGIDNG